MESKNIVNKKLEFLSKSREFVIIEKDDYFEIEFAEICYNDDYAPINATIDKETLKIKYYIGSCYIYDNGSNYVEIDIESLRKIMTFCKLLIENME